MSSSIARIMSKRKMSKGGEVANGGDDEFEELADSKPDNFDDLAMNDDLEFSYDAANSGDELDNKQENADRSETVARIMRQRKMKQRNPNPA